MLVVGVPRTSDAAGIEDESIPGPVRLVLIVTVPAENQRVRAATEPAIDRRPRRIGKTSIGDLLE